MNDRTKSRLFFMLRFLCSVFLVANMATLLRGMNDRDFRLVDALLVLMFSGLLIRLVVMKSPTYSTFWIGFTAGLLVVTLVSIDQVNWWTASTEGAEGPLWAILETPYHRAFSDEFLEARGRYFEKCSCFSCRSYYFEQHKDHYLRTAGSALSLLVAFTAGLAVASWGHFRRNAKTKGSAKQIGT